MIRPKRYMVKLAERELQLGDRTLIMGIINVTPDSFSDGGDNMDPDRACARALELEEAGADIIDIGAESTRPGSERISEAEELRRLIPVLKKLKGKLSIPISVDTSKSGVATRALENGAELINDASTLTFDMDLAKVISDANAGLVLNHMRGTPETWAKLGTLAHPMKAVMEDLEAGINRARQAGIDRSRIILDPGLGFGKRGEQNYELIARLGEMAKFDLPILVGPSRKSFLGQQETVDADRATGAAVTAAVLQGAHIVRVHNVASIRAVLQTADGIVRSIAEVDPDAKPRKDAVLPRNVSFADRKPATVPEENRPLRPPTPAAKPAVAKPFEERAPRVESGDQPPRRTFNDDERPPRRDDDAPPPRRDYGDRPQRSFSSDDRPPRRDYGGDDRPPRRFSGGDDRPPRRDFGGNDRPPRPPYGGGGDRPSGPPRNYGGGGDRPPRRDFGGGGDRPSGPPRNYGGGDRPSGPPRSYGGGGGDRPPRRDFGGAGDRQGGPPRRFSGGDDRPPRRDYGGGGDRPSGPPRSYGGGGGGDRPPYKRPFENREGGGDRPSFNKPYGQKNAGDRPPFQRAEGDRPPYRKPYGENREGGDRPPFKKYGGGGASGKPPYPKKDFKSSRSPIRSPRPKRND